jgi:iron complex transport system ATP-binding protein
MSAQPSLIDFENVSLVRGVTRILHQINLVISRGENVAIVGPNGSGKSSLLKMLMRFYYPSVVEGSSGRVRILGQETWNVWELRTQLGFISSEIDHHFCSGRSARLAALPVVLTGFVAGELEVESDAISTEMRRVACDLLHRFHMDPRSDKPIGHMSTGERRRVLLARAMALQPPALILDEPTSGLDLLARFRFLAQIEELANQGTQVVLVTHHLEELLPCLRRGVLLKQGQVFADGSISEVISEPTISALYDTPIRLHRDVHGYHVATLR